MEINIKELIENKDILIFLENDIDNKFPKSVIVRRSNGKLTDGFLTEIFTNKIPNESYGIVDVDNGNGCKVVSIQIKDKKLYKILDDKEFNLLKITINNI